MSMHIENCTGGDLFRISDIEQRRPRVRSYVYICQRWQLVCKLVFVLENSFGEVMVSRVRASTDARTKCCDMLCNRGSFLARLGVVCFYRLSKSCEHYWCPKCAICWCFDLSIDSSFISASHCTMTISMKSISLALFSSTQKKTSPTRPLS